VGRTARVRVAEILGVALPADGGRVQLVEQCWDGRRVHAAVGARGGVRPGGRDQLPVVGVGLERSRRVDGALHGVVVGAVGLGVGLRRLTADHGDVVVEAEMTRPEVVLQQYALGGQGLPQVGVVVQPGEARIVGLVLEDDQPHVLDLARLNPKALALRRKEADVVAWSPCRGSACKDAREHHPGAGQADSREGRSPTQTQSGQGLRRLCAP